MGAGSEGGRAMAFSLKLRTERAIWAYVLADTTISLVVTHLVLHVGIGHEEHLRYWKIATLICVVLGVVLAYFSARMNHRNTLLADELDYLARHDALTGTFSRRHFFQLAHEANAYPAAVILLDLDRFKTVNDRYGHAGGDLALRHLAGVLQDKLGTGEALARLGGEAFVVLVPRTDEAGGARLAQSLLSSLRKSPVMVEAEELTLTASFGVSLAASPDEIDAAVHRADLAMYAAKTRGRAQVCRHSEIDPPIRLDMRARPLSGATDQALRPRVRQTLRGQPH